MSSIDAWANFFGLCTLINFGIYLLTVIALSLFRDTVLKMNARVFAITKEEVSLVSFQYIGQYKLAITLLCFVPYVALKVMS